MKIFLLIIAIAVFAVTALSQTSPANKAIDAQNAAINTALNVGNAAIKAKKYTEAIDVLAAAINADPSHPGVSGLMLNLAFAKTGRGIEAYNAALLIADKQKKDSGMLSALLDLRESEQIAAGAAALLREQIKDARSKDLATATLPKALYARANALRMSVKLDPKAIPDAIKAFTEYITAETNLDLRIKARVDLAQMLFDAGEHQQSAAEAAKVLNLENDPKNVDALFLRGLSLALDDPNPKAKQSGANYLKQFHDLAPPGHPKRQDAKDTLQFLKETYGIVPK